MKKKVKQGIILTFLLLVAILIIPLSSVYSASEKLYLETSKETAIYGDEVTVTLNFKKEEGNLYAYTAKLSYDKDVFEEISKEDFQESESWKDVTYNSENNKFGLINKEGISSQNIIEVKLRVKENAKRGKTKISVTNAIASNGESDTSLGSAEKEVTIKENELDDVSGIENNTTPTEETKQEQTKKVESKINWPVIIVALIAVAIIIFLIYMFSKYSKIEKEKRKTITVVALIILAILLIVGICFSRRNESDVNTDSKVDYKDTENVMEYLLETENPETTNEAENADQNQAAMDVNQDGQISTSDVARTVKTVKKKNNINPTVKSASIKGGTTSNRRPTNTGSTNVGTNNGTQQNENGGNGGSQNNPGGESNPSVPTQNPPVEEPTIMPTATTPVIVPTASVEPEPSNSSPIETPTPNVEITSKETNIQIQNGKELELILDIELSSETKVKQVTIKTENGKKVTYDAIYNEEDGMYHVNLPNPYENQDKKYGKTTYEVTGVVLDNGNEVDLNKDEVFTITVDVLKQNPLLDSFVYNESEPSVTLTIEDRDDAITEGGRVYIYDNTGKQVIASYEIKEYQKEGTKKKVTLNIKDFEMVNEGQLQNGTYNFWLNIPYQLSESGETTLQFLTNQNKSESSEGPFNLDNVNITIDYKFDFKDLKISPKAEDQTLGNITPKTVKLQFTSTNEAINLEGVPVTVSKVKVKINTQNEEVIEKEATVVPVKDSTNQYEIEIEHGGEVKQTISIESVELSNGKVYVKQSSENTENAEKTDKLENQNVTIFLNKPIAKNITLNLGDENTNITSEYLLQDLDNTIKSENLKLDLLYKSSQNAEEIRLDTIEVQKNTKEKTVANFNKKVSDYATIIPNYEQNQGNGTYIVKLYGTYERIDGTKHEIQNETGFIAMATADKNVVKPKQEPDIIAEIETNSTPNKLKIDLSDPDGAFISGTVTIKKTDETIVKTETFKANEIPYNLTLNKEYLENGNYKIEITYTYQLKENEAPITKTKTLELNNFVSDYGVQFVEINDVTVQKKIENEQNGKITLKFTASTKTTNFINSIVLNENIPLEITSREGNLYTVEIPYNETTKKTFRITKLILDNGYAETLDAERMDTIFTVYLEKPEIAKKEDGTQELELSVNEEKQATAKVKINNSQNGSNYIARLTYPNESVPVEIPLVKGEQEEYTATFGKLVEIAGDYNLEILADYDLENGDGLLQNQILGSIKYTSELEAKITEGKIERAQPTKGEIVTITYTIQDNTGKTVKYIEVNGKKYEAKILSGLATDTETIYTVDVPVPLTNKKIDEQTGAPIVEFTATKLIYEGEKEEEEELKPAFSFEQKVQNAKPKYENTFENENEDTNKPHMKFHFTDPNEGQQAFRKATVKLKNSKGEVVKTREFTDIEKDYYFLLYDGEENEATNGKHPEGAIADSFTGMVDGEIYSIEVEIEYDIEYEVPGQENEAPGKVTETINGLQLNAKYNLTLNTKQEETVVNTNTGKTTIVFTSSNDLNAEIANVTIEKTVNRNYTRT